MPTPRRSGAPLVDLPLVTPAFKGLNKQAQTSVLGPEWATIATNAVFDSAGRLSARKGITNLTSLAVDFGADVEQLHEHIFEDGTTDILFSCGLQVWHNVSSPADLTGTATITVGNNWQFVNYNGLCLGFQQGETPIKRTTGNFSDLFSVSGTVPQGNAAVVHSGRIWATDANKQVIKYCALLDETNWATGAGNIDMSSVWPHGTDTITALAMFNGFMVVFGKNQIVLFGDGQGSALGINPNNIFVVDTIVGTGCIARDSVQQVDGGDLLFLSSQGIQSLGRLLQNKSNPITNVSANVRDYLNNLVASETPDRIRSIYSPENAFYLLSIPAVSKVFCFDTSGKLEDGSLRVTEWDVRTRAMVRANNGTVYMGLPGKVGSYSGYADNGVSYTFDYASAWLDLGEDSAKYIKILKTMTATLYISSSAQISLKWNFDFQDTFITRVFSLFNTSVSEWGIMEWGLGQWSGGLNLRKITSPASGSGQYLRVGLQTDVTGDVSVQYLKLFTKIGRIAK